MSKSPDLDAGGLPDMTSLPVMGLPATSKEQRFHRMIETAAEGYFSSTGRRCTIQEVNPALCAMLGRTPDELIGHSILEFVSQETREAIYQSEQPKPLAPAHHRRYQISLVSKSGQIVHTVVNASDQLDEQGRVTETIAFVSDISGLKETEAKLQHLATHDTLTGLANRAMLHDRLTQAIETAKAHHTRLAVFFIDLDRFKAINDSLGHDVGDALLKEISARFKDCLRNNDIVARFGGDEFVLVAENIRTATALSVIADKLLRAAAEPVYLSGQDLVVSASVGVSVYPDDGEDIKTLFRNADTAMYEAKANGRNNYQLFTQQMNDEANKRLMIENDLRTAIERNELEVYYQPKMNLRTLEVSGMEALLRWNHPTMGMVSPAEFIPVAECTGLILSIGKWVLKTACEQVMAWHREGHPLLRLSVNLSARQLKDDSFPAIVQEVLTVTGLPAKSLELELTESMLVEDSRQSAAFLKELKALGVELSIDDFGTGYSALAYLCRFPIDYVKLDRSFIQEAFGQDDASAVIKAVIALAHVLNIRVVAEGVEVQEQFHLLQDAECDEMQGYYFSKPLPVKEFVKLLATHANTGETLH